MPIDVAAALAAEPTVREANWTERDVLLYHLGLGAGVKSLDPAELAGSTRRACGCCRRSRWSPARASRPAT